MAVGSNNGMYCIIVDIGKPPSGSLTSFNAYVSLSRSCGHHSIRLLRDFNPKLFTIHPNEELRKEDLRWSKLENATQIRFETGELV